MPGFETSKAAVPLPSAELGAAALTTEIQFTTASAQNGVAAGQPLVCYLPGTGVLQRRPFKVRVGGRVKGGPAASNFTASVYFGTSSTIASNTKIATTGAIALAANTGDWALELDMVWDSTGTQFGGLQRGWVINTAVSQAALTATASTTTLTSESTSNGLTVTGQFSGGQTTNQAFVDWFEVLAI